MSDSNETKLRAALTETLAVVIDTARTMTAPTVIDGFNRVIKRAEAALSAPSIGTSGDQARSDALADYNFAAGLLAGWNFSQAGDDDGFHRAREAFHASAATLRAESRAAPQLVERKAQSVSDNGAVPAETAEERSLADWHNVSDKEFIARCNAAPDMGGEMLVELGQFVGGAAPEPTIVDDAMRLLDEDAVDTFAAAMKRKLAAAREKGRSGWQNCSTIDLSCMLRDHVEKGDPTDVANFAMFLWNLGSGIVALPAHANSKAASKLKQLINLAVNHEFTERSKEWADVFAQIDALSASQAHGKSEAVASVAGLIADMRRDVLIAIRDHAHKAPEEGMDGQPDETWQSWFVAAFDLAQDAVDDVLREFECSVLCAQRPVATTAAPVAQPDAKDGPRYRWLRDISVPPHNFYLSVSDEFKDEKYSPAQVDAAIDAALAQHAAPAAEGGA